MRITYSLFVVSVALFVSGIAFVIAGARAGRSVPAAAPTVAFTPVASTLQLMNALVTPAATVVYDSVGTISDLNGTRDIAPKNDQEWAAVAASAAVLAESANLLLMEGHAVDRGAWADQSRKLAKAAEDAKKAADNKSADGVMTAGAAIAEACDACHKTYQRQ